MAKKLGSEEGEPLKIKMDVTDFNLVRIVGDEVGLKWGVQEAMSLGLDSFSTGLIINNPLL